MTEAEIKAKQIVKVPSALSLLAQLFLSRKPKYISDLSVGPSPLRMHAKHLPGIRDKQLLAKYEAICGGSPLPLLYPQILASPLMYHLMLSEAFPVRLPGTVHCAHRVRVLEDFTKFNIDDLQIECRFGRFENGVKGIEFEVIVEWLTQDERPIWQSCATFMMRHPLKSRSASKRQKIELPSGSIIKDTWHFKGDTGLRYAKVSGDYNPIHLSPLTSKFFGFPQPIAHGLYSMAKAASFLNINSCEPASVRCEFLAPIVLPSTVEIYQAPANNNVFVTTLGHARICLVFEAAASS